MEDPRHPRRRLNRSSQCEQTFESFFLAVTDLADDAGWTPDLTCSPTFQALWATAAARQFGA